MHCVDVIRELSAPTGEPDPAALAEHLAGCPACATWAERSARLDRLWEATRPSGPSDAAWDRIWANVSAALDRPGVPVAPASRPAPASPRPWRRSVLAAFTVAQAAAILAAFTLAWRESSRPHPAPRAPAEVVAVVPATVEIDPGQDALISLDRAAVHLVARADSPNGVSSDFLGLNAMEGLATLQ